MKHIFGKMLLVGALSVSGWADYYEDGRTALKNNDDKKAFNFFSKACDNGDASGCAMVGAYYKEGFLGDKNFYKALSYYEKACRLGNEPACEDLSELKARLPICSESEISFINDKRYFHVSSSVTYPLILADTETIRIDKKNKTIKVWTVWIVSDSGRQNKISKLGKNFDNNGYEKSLYTINYGSMKMKINSSQYYNCNGSVIYSNNSSTEWHDIVPDSVTEGITQSIMKKYNLK